MHPQAALAKPGDEVIRLDIGGKISWQGGVSDGI